MKRLLVLTFGFVLPLLLAYFYAELFGSPFLTLVQLNWAMIKMAAILCVAIVVGIVAMRRYAFALPIRVAITLICACGCFGKLTSRDYQRLPSNYRCWLMTGKLLPTNVVVRTSDEVLLVPTHIRLAALDADSKGLWLDAEFALDDNITFEQAVTAFHRQNVYYLIGTSIQGVRSIKELREVVQRLHYHVVRLEQTKPDKTNQLKV